MESSLKGVHMQEHTAKELGSSGAVCFVGSRHGMVKRSVSSALVSAFIRLGSRFLVGGAPGIDRCFRQSLAASPTASRCTVHEIVIMDGFGLPHNSAVRDVLKSLEKSFPILPAS